MGTVGVRRVRVRVTGVWLRCKVLYIGSQGGLTFNFVDISLLRQWMSNRIYKALRF